MKAIVQRSYGEPADLELVDIDQPAVKDGEVLVRVHAAAVNPGDVFVLRGVPYLMRTGWGLRRPRQLVPGMDVAGTVAAVGAGVTRFRPGDAVFGVGRGTFAELARGGQDTFVPKPERLTFEQAAALPTAGLTALHGMRDAARVRPGQQVLVNGAGGGVGSFAVQIAKALGAEVTGVCSTSKVELVRSLGADHVVDYTREDFTERDERYDVILDNVANHPLSRLRRVLTPRGTLLPNNGETGGRWFGPLGRLSRTVLLSLVVRQRLRPFVSMPKRDDLAALAELVDAGKVTPVVDQTFPLREAAKAVGYFAEGHARGRVIITV